jgi:dipeptidyl aminopeptidase/acylaminoacyl peptidase
MGYRSWLIVLAAGMSGCGREKAETNPTEQRDGPTAIAKVSLPKKVHMLAWSEDGKYIAAAGSSGAVGDMPRSSEVFIVDIGKEAIAAKLETLSLVKVLAFSPDGKWLAVTAERWGADQKVIAAELVVFEVTSFTAKLKAQAIVPKNAFTDVAWSGDSKVLHAIDGQEAREGKQEVRRWDIVAFTEQPAIEIDKPQDISYKALAASPDGLTLAIAEQTELNHLLIRIFNLAKGKEIAAFKIAETVDSPRLGYTADGKAVGVLNSTILSWWNPATGQSVDPAQARFSIRPPNYPLSPDGNIRVRAFSKNRLFSDIGGLLDGRDKDYGTFVELTRNNPPKTWEWRIGPGSTPAVALSPDGTKVVGVEELPNGGAIVLWPMPK